MKNKLVTTALAATALVLASCTVGSTSSISSEGQSASSSESSSSSSTAPSSSSASSSASSSQSSSSESSSSSQSSSESSESSSSSSQSSSVAPSLSYSDAVGGINSDLDTEISELKLTSVDTSSAYESFYFPHASGTDSNGDTVVFATYDYKMTTQQDVKIYANNLLTNDVVTADVDGTGADVPSYDTDTTTFCYFDADDVYRAIQIDHKNDDAISGGVMAMPQDWIDEGSTVAEGKTEYIYNWGLGAKILGNITGADTTYPDSFSYNCVGSLSEGYTLTVSFIDPEFSTIYNYFGTSSDDGIYDGPVSWTYSATITVDSSGLVTRCVSSQITSIATSPLTGKAFAFAMTLEDYEETSEVNGAARVDYTGVIPVNPNAVPVAFYGKFYPADGKGYYWIKLMSGAAYVYVYVFSTTKNKNVIDGGATAVAYSPSTQSIDFSYTSKSDTKTYDVSLTLNDSGDLVVKSTNGDTTTTTVYLTAAHYASLG